MRSYIILGGNFQNTGAGSMTLIMADEIRKRFPDAEITVFAPMKDAVESRGKYTFEVAHMSGSTLKRASAGSAGPRYYAEGLARLVLGKGNQFKEYRRLKELLARCSGVFDISGYAISSQFRNQNTLGKLANVDLFTKHGIPFYFMPQSFGPFDYRENREYMLSRLRETLPKAAKIFARESEGYEMLKELIGEGNIVRSYDMVLQSRGIEKKNIYKTEPPVHEIPVETGNNAALIPNMRNFDHGNREEILALYDDVVRLLLELGKNVYLISHSAEDSEACGLIRERFAGDDRVILVGDKIDSWNYDALIRKFDFAIASRFHSIVHAYRAGTPCIALGWATKYRELLEAMEQREYIFDVRDLRDKEKLLAAVRHMNENYEKEKEIIKKRLLAIRETNCFDMIDF